MGKKHDHVAQAIADKLHGTYDPTCNPDVKGPKARAEVKSTAAEIPQALRQLSGGKGAAYIVLPATECAEAKDRLKDLKTGIMDYTGKVVKPSTRKK